MKRKYGVWYSMYLIKELTDNEILEMYSKYINDHFPADEVKPLETIGRMLKEDFYYGLGLYDANGEYKTEEEYENFKEECEEDVAEQLPLIGYAFFVKDTKENMLLLDYYAILEEYRNSGWGSIFLNQMRDIVEDYKGILLETEDIDFARDEVEKSLRERRDGFYARNGVIKTDVKSKLFGVNFAIWFYPVKEELTSSECRESLINIYKTIVPEHMYEKCVEIW